MISLKKKASSGFTIVELLIVIVVIGILAALVVTTYNGIQQKARDTERKTDINAIHSQVEAYQAQNGKYPTFTEMNDNVAVTGFRVTQLKGLDAAAFADPKNAGNDQLVNTPTVGRYAYEVLPAACDNTATDCTTYTLTAKMEQSGQADYVKKSLN